ncbi:MAG: hypothetical protein AAGK21_15780, partial [Bacteroidota bacterium]
MLFVAPVTEAQACPLGSFGSTALGMTGRGASQQSNPLADGSPASGAGLRVVAVVDACGRRRGLDGH